MKHPNTKPSNKIIHHAVIAAMAGASVLLDREALEMKLRQLPVTLAIILNILSLAAFSYDHFDHAVILLLEGLFCLLFQLVQTKHV